MLWITFAHMCTMVVKHELLQSHCTQLHCVNGANLLSHTDRGLTENNTNQTRPSKQMQIYKRVSLCVFLSNRPHENISHSTEDCSHPPEADQRSISPQWRRCRAHRAQPAGTTAVICSVMNWTPCSFLPWHSSIYLLRSHTFAWLMVALNVLEGVGSLEVPQNCKIVSLWEPFLAQASSCWEYQMGAGGPAVLSHNKITQGHCARPVPWWNRLQGFLDWLGLFSHCYRLLIILKSINNIN